MSTLPPLAIEVPNADEPIATRRSRRRVVGYIPGHFVLACRKKKKHSKSIEVREVGLDTITGALSFFRDGADIGCRTIHEVYEMYTLAKLLGSDDLTQACVRRVWDLRDVWIHVDIGDRDREEDDVWMYDTLINHTCTDAVVVDEEEEELHNALLDESGGGDDDD